MKAMSSFCSSAVSGQHRQIRGTVSRMRRTPHSRSPLTHSHFGPTLLSSEGEIAMTSSFNVNKASGYELLMGRWSRILAPLFIEFAGVNVGERVLDVGCGTGSLTFALPQAANVAEISAIDYSPVFVEEAMRRNADPRISIRQ